ncbi:Quinolinate synthase A [Planctomycetes bacterium Pla163]|uniref:quinolinate synthase n=1 Tax=Rohdeia mirabilis TaxID=2528008 RepID=A0A518CZS7_9BACT|nr:Quinolinate synthase A [Planctomycetes bacterium Pla163]
MSDLEHAPHTPSGSGARITLEPALPICQTALPLDWYQEPFKPYAEEFLALERRDAATVLAWMDPYMARARDHFGDELLLLAHFYMGGEIVKLIEHYGGAISDSYALALQARNNPDKRVIVESAVHFMAESIAILAHDHQSVWITNPKAGCTMEMLAKDYMVLPVADQLIERYGDDLTVIAYMNTSGRLKALSGRTKGASCTSSNAHLVMDWALSTGKRVLFVPDQHLGRNTAVKLGLTESDLRVLPDPARGAIDLSGRWDDLDRARVLLWGSACGVHTIFSAEMVRWWQARDYRVLVHPESPLEAVQAADGSGSTNYLWSAIEDAPAGSKLAIGTEGHFVRNARDQAAARGVEVVHLAEIPEAGLGIGGCGCATMSRNDPPHLVGLLDLLVRGEAPDINRVLAGDSVDELSMRRDRLDGAERKDLIADARYSLEKMIEIVESSTD